MGQSSRVTFVMKNRLQYTFGKASTHKKGRRKSLRFAVLNKYNINQTGSGQLQKRGEGHSSVSASKLSPTSDVSKTTWVLKSVGSKNDKVYLKGSQPFIPTLSIIEQVIDQQHNDQYPVCVVTSFQGVCSGDC